MILIIFSNSVAAKIDANIVKTESQFHESLKNPNEKTLFLTQRTTVELGDHLKFLNDRKAIGINSIPTKIFKTFKKLLSQPLTELFNLIFSTETFPDCLFTKKILFRM